MCLFELIRTQKITMISLSSVYFRESTKNDVDKEVGCSNILREHSSILKSVQKLPWRIFKCPPQCSNIPLGIQMLASLSQDFEPILSIYGSSHFQGHFYKLNLDLLSKMISQAFGLNI